MSVQDIIPYYPHLDQTAIDTCSMEVDDFSKYGAFCEGAFRITPFLTSSVIQQIFVSTNRVMGWRCSCEQNGAYILE